MKPYRLIQTLLGLLALPALTTGAALAKPGHGDGKVTIVGPGINGVIEVTDPEIQSGLSPYNFLAQLDPYIEAPHFAEGEGYDIVYSFKHADGTYEAVERMRYVPNPDGGPGYVYYLPDLGHTGTWFRLTPEGEARLQRVLTAAGVPLAPAAQAHITAPAEAPVVSRPVLSSGWLIALGIAVVSVLALSGLLLQLSARPAKA